jgi:hypothetical protein
LSIGKFGFVAFEVKRFGKIHENSTVAHLKPTALKHHISDFSSVNVNSNVFAV